MALVEALHDRFVNTNDINIFLSVEVVALWETAEQEPSADENAAFLSGCSGNKLGSQTSFTGLHS